MKRCTEAEIVRLLVCQEPDVEFKSRVDVLVHVVLASLVDAFDVLTTQKSVTWVLQLCATF